MQLFSYSSTLPLLLATCILIANSCCTAAEAFLSSNPVDCHHHHHHHYTNTFRHDGGDDGGGSGGGSGIVSSSSSPGWHRIAAKKSSSLSNSLLSTLIKNRGGGGAFGGNLGGSRVDRGGSTRSSDVGRAAASTGSASTTQSSSSSSSSLSSSSSSSSSYIPPIFNKTNQERNFIRNVLQANFLFQDFCRTTNTGNENKYNNDNELDLSEIICAFEQIDFTIDSLLCKQGDIYDTDYLYIIYDGECSVYIDGQRLQEPFGTMTEGALIGDVAMIYETSRAATVQAITPVKAYRLHRQSFNYFLNSSNEKQNEKQSSSSSSSSSKLSPKEQMQKEVKEIDLVIDQISGVKTKYDNKIIMPFKPTRKWLWTRWKGTIMQYAWRTACLNMCMVAIFHVLLRFTCNNLINKPITWSMWMIPDKSHPIIARMIGMNGLWKLCLTITTFTLTFFLAEAYTLWRDIYTKGRSVQSRLNDISLLLASRAERDPKTNKYTVRASKTLEEVAGCIRLFHSLMWASYTRKFAILLTPKGLSRMLSRGCMTRKQYECLVNGNNSDTVATTTLQWIYIRLIAGIQDGAFPQSNIFETICTGALLALNDSMSGIGDTLDAKIPLAYAQFVQILVDTFLILSPFALYSELGMWAMPACGLLYVFYGGMLDLAKILLFPLENNEDDFYTDTSVNMDIGVLLRESNANSNRWKTGIETLPF